MVGVVVVVESGVRGVVEGGAWGGEGKKREGVEVEVVVVVSCVCAVCVWKREEEEREKGRKVGAAAPSC